MKSDETQKELFEDFQDKKRPFKMPRGILTRPTYVSIPLERLIFVGIGVLMALVIAHAIGVERGKTSVRHEPRKVDQAAKPKEIAFEQYTILIGTFHQRTSLDAAAQNLRKKGYDPFILRQGENMLLCAGRYASKKEAEGSHPSLKAIYNECSIRRLR